MPKMRKFFKSNYQYLIIIFFATFLLGNLFAPGFFPIHDDTQVTRVYLMAKSLSDGMFPVRWVSDLGYGYGYPIFNFYGPFAYYIGAIFVLLGISPLTATKIMIAFPVFVLGIGAYLLAEKFWGRSGALITSILAMSAPYVALLIFVRGAVGELYGLAFIPLVLYSLYNLYETKRVRFLFLAAIFQAALITSHNLTAFYSGIFIFIFVLIISFIAYRKKQLYSVFQIVSAVLLGVLLSSFYWLPAILEMRFTNVISQVGGGADFRDHFVCLPQLWESSWGFGGSVKGCIDGLSFRLGKAHILLAIIALPLVFILKEKKPKLALAVGFLFLTIATFLTTHASMFIWENLAPFAYIQYPWRFLGMMSLSSAFISGSLVLYLDFLKIKKSKNFYITCILSVAVLGLVVALYFKLFNPQTIIPNASEDYTAKNIINFKISKISDEYLPSDFIKPLSEKDLPTSRLEVVSPSGVSLDILEIESLTHREAYKISINEQADLKWNIASFPAWRIYLDGNPIDKLKSSNGTIFTVPAGKHDIEAVYESTPVQKIANLASMIGVFIIIVGIIISSRRRIL